MPSVNKPRVKNPRTARAAGLTLAGVVALFVLLAAPGVHLAQTKKPITKNGLLEAVKLNGLSTAELIERVQQRGVNFRLTAADEQEFKAAGARPELLDAVRANYKPDSGSGPAVQPTPSAGQPPRNVPQGAPLSQNEVISMLQAGAPSDRVEQFVEARGVDFKLTPDLTRKIKQAGGSNGLIGAITEKSMAMETGTSDRRGPAGPRGPVAPARTGPDYDELTDQAMVAMQANNAASAVSLLQQAIKLEPARPTAYSLLGFAELYGYKNIAVAEPPMRAAIERGGSATFRVYHDHDGFFKTYCTGSFFVTRAGMTFKADNGVHTFEADKGNVQEVKLNGMVGANFGAFHVKVQGAGKAQNYNFAPATTSKQESNLIVSLIQGYR